MKHRYSPFVSAVLSVCLILQCLLLLFPLAGNADTPTADEVTAPTKSQLVSLAQEADLFADLLVYGTGRKPNNNPTEYNWAVEKGYLDEHALNGVDLHLDELFGIPNLTCYPYSATMDSLESWEKEVDKYFISDIYALITPQKQGLYSTTTVNYWLLSHEGRTYFSPFPTKQLIADWSDTELVSANGNHAVLSMRASDAFAQGEGSEIAYTVEFTNTENGWRISGGTFGEQIYKMYNNGPIINPPVTPPAETGDSAVYAAWTMGLVLLALTAVIYRKKKI